MGSLGLVVWAVPYEIENSSATFSASTFIGSAEHPGPLLRPAATQWTFSTIPAHYGFAVFSSHCCRFLLIVAMPVHVLEQEMAA